MMIRERWRIWVTLFLVVAASMLAVWSVSSWFALERDSKQTVAQSPATHQPVANAAGRVIEAAQQSDQVEGRLDISRPWGSGEAALGRVRPKEGNPEAPMSFAVSGEGSLLVLDQVNGRLVRIERGGRTTATVGLQERVPQDVALGPRGETAVLDRLGDHTVIIRSPTGQVVGSLPLQGQGLGEPGLITGVFIDGEDVYVERRHGPLVLLGDIKGNVAQDRTEIPGRPTRDGTLFVSAGIVDAQAGRMYVSAIDRKLREHRFTREIRTGAPVRSIALLDSDRRGTVYVGVVLEISDAESRRVYCLEPLRGDPLGQIDVPISSTPEETLRDMAVMDNGGVVIAEASEWGLRYLEHHCQ